MPAELDLLLRARYPLIWLDTAEERRAVELICRTASSLGDPVAGWCQTYGVHDLPGEPEPGGHNDPVEALRFVRRQERRTIWVLKDIGELCSHAQVVRAIRDTAQALKPKGGTLVCVGSGQSLPQGLGGEATTHRLALPRVHEHIRQLREVAEELNLRVEAAALRGLSTACLGLSLEQAENIWARIHAKGGRFDARDLPHVLAEKARIVRESGFLEFIPSAGMDAVGGLGQLKLWLKRRRLAFSEAARAKGLPYPRGALLVGVQGCGKSLSAKAVAGSWGQPLLRLDVGSLMEGYVGASERNFRAALELAERVAPCVLWLDEIEKAFTGTGSSNDGGVVTRLLGQMLTWMQEKESPVFVLATANQIDALPPELLRKGRFDEIFFVDLPDATQRAEIWRIHVGARAQAAQDVGLTARLDLQTLSERSEGYNGAEIAAAVVEGAFAALAEGEALETAHLTAALKASPPLSKTRRESIDALRDWARGRARRAS